MSLAFLPALEQARLVRDGEVSSRELVELYLERIERLDGGLKAYVTVVADQALSVNSVLRFSSSRAQGLGDALQAGTVRVYQRDARGNPQFVGEHRIGHTPMGSDIGLATGQAFDVKVRPVVEERTRINDRRWRTRMRYTLTNAGPRPVTARQPRTSAGDSTACPWP